MDIHDIHNALEITVKPYISISTELANITSPWQSKFGGFPYLPIDFDYPKTADGDYLYLLAQINFAEVPELEGFPKQGILQFYIGNDDLYGLNFDNQFAQNGFRVLYFPEPLAREVVTDFSFMPLDEDIYLPVQVNSDECFTLSFEKKSQPISISDYKFKDFAEDGFKDIIYENEDILVTYLGEGHKIGGYPFFTQNDPREYLTAQNDEPYILLLQIDNDENIMWGDAGVGNFFIKASDLKQLNFANVMYNWDCC